MLNTSSEKSWLESQRFSARYHGLLHRGIVETALLGHTAFLHAHLRRRRRDDTDGECLGCWSFLGFSHNAPQSPAREGSESATKTGVAAIAQNCIISLLVRTMQMLGFESRLALLTAHSASQVGASPGPCCLMGCGHGSCLMVGRLLGRFFFLSLSQKRQGSVWMAVPCSHLLQTSPAFCFAAAQWDSLVQTLWVPRSKGLHRRLVRCESPQALIARVHAPCVFLKNDVVEVGDCKQEGERDIKKMKRKAGPDKSLKSPMGFRCMHPFSHPCMTQRESRAPDFVCLYRCVDCAPSWSARQMSSGQRIAAWIPS